MADGDDHPCLIDAPHLRHDWYPLVADPEDDHVLHLGMAAVTCPGVTAKEWLERKRADAEA